MIDTTLNNDLLLYVLAAMINSLKWKSIAINEMNNLSTNISFCE